MFPNLKVYSTRTLISAAFLLLFSLSTQAQCPVYNSPYHADFPNTPAGLSCWTTNTGSASITQASNSIHDGYLLFDDANQGGVSTLISPYIKLNNRSFLTYLLAHHMGSGINAPVSHDSLKVFIRTKSQTIWSILRNYKAPFPGVRSLYRVDMTEDILLDTTLIGDTVQIKLEHYTTTARFPLFLYNFKIEHDQSDSLWTLPYYENFDGPNWRPDSSGTGFNNQAFKINPNWRSFPSQRISSFARKWVVSNTGTSSVSTGPANDYSGSGKFLYTEASMTYAADPVLYTPRFDLSQIPYVEFSYWYHMYGEDMGSLLLECYRNDTWEVIDSINGQQQTSETAPWKQRTIRIDSLQMGHFRFRKRFSERDTIINSSWLEQDAAIDEISIRYTPCPYPFDLALSFSQISTNSARADWTAGPNSLQYIVEYDSVGFVPGTGQIDTVSAEHIYLLNLTSKTTYDVYIRFLCGATLSSSIRGPYRFTTECDPIIAPYFEHFDDATLDQCWFAHNTAEDTLLVAAAWTNTSSAGFPAYGASGAIDHTGNGGFAMGVDGSFPYPLDSIALLSPFIDVSSLAAPFIKFYLFSNNTNNPGQNNRFYVDFYDGSTWHDSVIVYAGDNPNWVELKLSLRNFAISGPIRLRFLVDKSIPDFPWFNDILLDDFSIEDGFGDGCVQTQSVAIQNFSCDSVTMLWTSDSTTTGTSIKYGPKGFNYATSGTWNYGITSPWTIHGLNPNTTYDFYLIDSCVYGYSMSQDEFTTNTGNTPNLGYTYTRQNSSIDSILYTFDAQSTFNADTIYWDFGAGNFISGPVAQWYFKTNGTKNVVLHASNACGSSYDSLLINITNINTYEIPLHNKLTLFPNPNHGTFVLEGELELGRQYHIHITNQQGANVYQEVLQTESDLLTHTLNLRKLSPGMYFFKLYQNQKLIFSKKLILL